MLWEMASNQLLVECVGHPADSTSLSAGRVPYHAAFTKGKMLESR
jgi:hypothetical protein